MFLKSIAAKGKAAAPSSSYPESAVLPVLPADQLLTGVRLQLIQHDIIPKTGLSLEEYESVYAALLNNFAEFTQLIPMVSRARLGGILDNGLKRSDIALDIFLSETPDADPLIVYAIFSAALLMDIRQIFVDKKIIMVDEQGVFIDEWMPLEGALVGKANFYKIRYFYQPASQLSSYLNVFLARQLMPEMGLLWLSSDIKIFNQWLGALAGDEDQGGIIWRSFHLIKSRWQALTGESEFPLPVNVEEPKTLTDGEAFWEWLQQSVADNAINVNQADSDIQILNEEIRLKFPEIFEAYCRTVKTAQDWQKIAQQFQDMGIIAGEAKITAEKEAAAEKTRLTSQSDIFSPAGRNATNKRLQTKAQQREGGQQKEKWLIVEKGYFQQKNMEKNVKQSLQKADKLNRKNLMLKRLRHLLVRRTKMAAALRERMKIR